MKSIAFWGLILANLLLLGSLVGRYTRPTVAEGPRMFAPAITW